jgi:hypothetical protein
MFQLLKDDRDDVVSAWGRDHHALATLDEPRARRASEIMLAAVAVVYPAWHWMFMAVMPAARDSLTERLVLGALMVAAIAGFRFRSLRRHLPAVEQVLLFVVAAHHLSLVWRNGLALPYLVGTLVVFASVSAVINRFVVALTFFAFCSAAVGLMMFWSSHPVALRSEFFVGMATVMLALTLGIYRASVVRQAAMTRISQSQRLMKQIIETIPDPIFVRTADRQLVLSNEAGRQFENATGYDLGAVVRQEDETISAGRTLEADAEVSTNVGPMAVSVKTALTVSRGQPTMLVTVMRDVTERRGLEESLRRRLRELEEARARVRQLQGMLPICMHCSRIRVADEQWEKLEQYVANNSNASFTHTLCATCLEQHYPS